MSPLEDALETLRRGGLIGLPTETVYGLAGDAARADTVASIYELKNRPTFNPLIAHVSSLEMAEELGRFSDLARKLAETFWPGPLTLVLPVAKTNPVCDLARAGLDTQAIRWPAHEIAQKLISAFGKPVVAPSANKSGKVSPTTRKHVEQEFGTALTDILDGGASVLGLESTVISVLGNEATLLRIGSLPKADIEAVTGPLKSALLDEDAPKSPGMLSRHYSPDAKLRLNASVRSKPDEAYLGFGPSSVDATMNLSEAANLTEAAANLYAMLRTLDESYSAIAVAPIPDTGLGEAINDRLRRAALQD
ncbi:MAG: threonylcarbamoyl-AMP synthase [Ponticaulis sp.]|nr:threonylcarbamoyl-AMP synthase [Ponticaulis sp.]|tara:strand:- start:12331 stop:13251 length:921 start_codon:yes stop_codon:yes gene_type:complete